MKRKKPKEITKIKKRKLKKSFKRVKHNKLRNLYNCSRESCTLRKLFWKDWFASTPALLTMTSKILIDEAGTFPLKYKYINIGRVVTGSEYDNKIFTIISNENVKERIPMVIIHGFGGLALDWIDFAKFINDNEKRPIYLFDTIGFNQSSRPSFFKYTSDKNLNDINSNNDTNKNNKNIDFIPPAFENFTTPALSFLVPSRLRLNLVNKAFKAEMEFIKSIEAWRSALKLEKFILVGHSFGGYLAASYAINYPKRISHLVLADPWGFMRHSPISKVCRHLIKIPFNLLFFARLAGPMYIEKCKNILEEHWFYCNSQNPTGEEAFAFILGNWQSARNPMIERMHLLPHDVPVTFMYGSRTWVKNIPALEFQRFRNHKNVKILTVKNAGHILFADNRKDFNYKLNKIALEVDAESKKLKETEKG